MINVTHDDLLRVLRQSANSPKARIKLEVLNDSDMTYAGTIYGTVSGTFNITADADVRRTCTLVVQPSLIESIKINENNLVWLNKDIHVWIGIYDHDLGGYYWYSFGYYVYTDAGITYSATANQLTLNLADFMKKLDGTKNGQLGASTISIPAYEEDDDGNVVSYNTIRDVMISTLEQLGGIDDYLIEEMGEKNGLEYYNEDYDTYRENNEDWNAIPYDLEFSAGCSVLSIITELRDLYPNYETFFDPEDNVFTCQLIPNGDDDEVAVTNEFLQRVFISESTTLSLIDVRNVCEVYGETIEVDFYSEDVTCTDNVYYAEVDAYIDENDDEEDQTYQNNDIVGLKIPEENDDAPYLNICSLGSIPILYQSDDSAVEAGAFTAETVYVFKIRVTSDGDEEDYKAYYMGQWQAQAVNVLTDGSESLETETIDDVDYQLYSEKYFQALYNCQRVDFMVVEDSPYTIQKLGLILDVKTGDEYDNITTDDLAAERARWENWKNARLTDNVTITTIFLPFLDVNQKVSYQAANEDEPHDYMVNSITHNFDAYTTSITMYRYYPYYES